jgi:hypothetical protein
MQAVSIRRILHGESCWYVLRSHQQCVCTHCKIYPSPPNIRLFFLRARFSRLIQEFIKSFILKFSDHTLQKKRNIR